MDKVKITQKQADSLEVAIKDDGKASVLSQHAIDGTDWCNACEGLNLMPLMTLASALVNGYEVEETPEDKVRAYYNQQNDISTASMDTGADVIRKVLNLLGKEIEGVNA